MSRSRLILLVLRINLITTLWMRYYCPLFMEECDYKTFVCNQRARYLSLLISTTARVPDRTCLLSTLSLWWPICSKYVRTHFALRVNVFFLCSSCSRGLDLVPLTLSSEEVYGRTGSRSCLKSVILLSFMKKELMEGWNCLYLTGRWRPLKIEKDR